MIERIKKLIKQKKPVKILFTQKQAPGDILVMTASIRDLKKSYPFLEIGVDTSAMSIWDNNPYINRKIDKKNADVVLNLKYPLVNKSNQCGKHFIHGFKEDIEEKLDILFDITELKCDVHLSEQEKKWINQVHQHHDYKGKFWVINAGHKSCFPLKQFPLNSWQEFADKFNDHFNGRVKIVQVGELSKNHHHKPLDGVIDLVGQTDLRQLIRLVWHAHGVVGHVSMLNHLASAYKKPSVVIAGGREADSWESYHQSRYLDTIGTMKCCAYGGCWKSKPDDCVDMMGDIPRCMTLIKPERVFDSVKSYYDGGILEVPQ